ncbi:MAG: TetR/AcrR family transcriptional regulator [Sphingomonadaceae bacterium]|nr:TetR/AcrR family transcriptional regulator [Sphingomonadaceae bacterium]
MPTATARKPSKRSPGRPRDKSRETAILAETLAILGEGGFAGLTVDAVVARAKASKATIYRRWATKEELAIAAFDLLPLIEVANTGSLEEDLVAYIGQYGEYLATTPLPSVLPALVAEAMHNDMLAEKLRQTVASRRGPGVDLIRRAIARGELPSGTDPELAHELIISPMLHRSFFDPSNFQLGDFRQMARVVIAGLRAISSEA